MKAIISTETRSSKITGPADTTSEVAYINIDSSLWFVQRYLYFILEFRDLIHEDQPELLIAHRSGFHSLLTAIISIIYNIQFIQFLGGDTWGIQQKKREESWKKRSPTRIIKYSLITGINAIAFYFCDGYIVVSEELRDKIIQKRDVDRDRVKIVHVPITESPSVEVKQSTIRKELGVSEQKVVLTVSNLMFDGKYRAISESLESINSILEDKEVAYVIAGGGSYEDQLRDDISTMIDQTKREQVYFAGYVDDIDKYYMMADVLLYVSYIDGYPNVVIEAQSVGLPVVANARFGMLEQINNEESGVLVSTPADVESPIRELLSSESYREYIGENGQRRVKLENSMEAIGKELESAVCSLCGTITEWNNN